VASLSRTSAGARETAAPYELINTASHNNRQGICAAHKSQLFSEFCGFAKGLLNHLETRPP
jgi:hypothetical protein